MKKKIILLILIALLLIIVLLLTLPLDGPKQVKQSRMNVESHSDIIAKIVKASNLHPDVETEVVVINMEIDSKRINNLVTKIPAHTKLGTLRAIDGHEFRASFEGLIDWENTCSKKTVRNCSSNGEIGCAFSHISLWHYLLQSPNKKYLVVLEDDATPSDHFIRDVEKMVKKLPENWTQILLGYNASWNTKNEVPTIAVEGGANVKGLYEMPLNVLKTGAYGYVISREGARQFIQSVLPLKKPIDNILGISGRYLSIPAVVSHQYLFPSNLNNVVSFKLIVTVHDAGDYLEKCLESIASQKEHCDVCIVDDASKNPQRSLINKYCTKYGWQSIFQTSNSGPLHSRIAGMNKICTSNSDIVVLIDGDDALVPKIVLGELRRMYGSGTQPVVTYGRYKRVSASDGLGLANESAEKQFQSSYDSTEFINNIADSNTWRDVSYRFSHLKTFRYGLFKQINVADLQDDAGDYFRSATDVAIMIPLLEMAGRRVKCSKQILYLYTSNHPLSLHMNEVTARGQKENHNIIRQRQKYTPVDDDVLQKITKRQKNDVLALHIDDHMNTLRDYMIKTNEFPERVSFSINTRSKFIEMCTKFNVRTLGEIGFSSGHAAIVALIANPNMVVHSFYNSHSMLSKKCSKHLKKYYPDRWFMHDIPTEPLQYDIILVNTDGEFELDKCKYVLSMFQNDRLEEQCKQRAIPYIVL